MKCIIAFTLAALMLCGAASALAEEYYNIAELRQQTPERLNKSYETKCGQVHIDVPIIIPEYEKLPAIAYRNIPHFSIEFPQDATYTDHYGSCYSFDVNIERTFSMIEDDILQKKPAESSRLTISRKVVERKALTIAEVADIIRQLPLLNESDRAFVILPLYTGMRRSEVLGVKWSDVNFEQKYISVTRGITFTGNRPVIGPPKSAAGYRLIPLLPELEAFLHHMTQTGVYIIGGNLITETIYKRTWERISRTIDLHGATAHTFRHTFATVAAPHLDVKTLQTIMGHADIATTLDRYTHPQEKRVLAASQTLGGIFSDF